MEYNEIGRRIGIFNLPREIILTAPDLARTIMGRCIILRAEMYFHHDGIEYHALCEEFDEVEEGSAIPEYWIDIWMEDESISAWKFRRKGTGEDYPILKEVSIAREDDA